MPDIFEKEKRSEIMSRIRSSGTKPERLLYTIVGGILGHRWRIRQNVSELPGQPDIVVPTLVLAIFADGCFFHGCPKHGHIPNSNRDYWKPKLEGNVKRDRDNGRKLRSLGYEVWRYWGHEFENKHLGSTHRRIEGKLAERLVRWEEAGKPRRLLVSRKQRLTH